MSDKAWIPHARDRSVWPFQYATAKVDLDWISPTIKAGTRMRVVMASRLGDIGLTVNLDKENGYQVRVPTDWFDTHLSDMSNTPERSA